MYVHARRRVRTTRKKQKVTINLTPEITRKAKELGLNISKTCENALKQAITRLEQPPTPYNTTMYRKPVAVEEETIWWTGRDSNPRPPPCEGGIHTRLNYRPTPIIPFSQLNALHQFTVYSSAVQFNFFTRSTRTWPIAVALSTASGFDCLYMGKKYKGLGVDRSIDRFTRKSRK